MPKQIPVPIQKLCTVSIEAICRVCESQQTSLMGHEVNAELNQVVLTFADAPTVQASTTKPDQNSKKLRDK
ncbi:MAG: hypothetical protein WCR07_05350 [Verrucomicrobiota bacterium]|jgi:hypothetical protein